MRSDFLCVCKIFIYIFTDTHNVAKHLTQVHSALATLSVTARQAMHGGNQQTRQRKQGILHNMFISGHAQASPEATYASPSKHAYRGTIQQEVPPNQSHAELPQSTSHNRGPQDTARARSLIPSRMQERHCRLAQAPIGFH
jgi:hypothetical protein